MTPNKIRSDCKFEIRIKRTGGLKITVNSKVSAMYGRSIIRQIKDMCKFFHIKNAHILIEDYGALPFVIAARFEYSVKKIFPELNKEFLLPLIKENLSNTKIDRLRRSRLYLPGNQPKLFINAGLHKADGIILDLEDSVSPSEKNAAKLLVRNALRSVNFYNSERMVRINQLPEGIDDLKFIIPHNVQVILIPKCETAEQVNEVESEIIRIKKESDIKNNVYLMPIIESALGVINAYKIASASKLNCALTIGLEDYTADIGTQRTEVGKESLFARSAVVNAAKAAGIQAIDTVYSDISNMDGLRESVLEAKSLGFEGKGCIHPRQIKVVHKAFAPTEEEIEKARKIVKAFKEAEKKGLGVVALGSKMIDPPVVKRALKIMELVNSINC